MSAADDALDVAMLTVCRWRDPRFSARSDDAQLVLAETYCKNREWVAAAERVLVERGLGEDLVEALMVEVDHAPVIEIVGRHRIVRLTLDWVAAVAFAPLDARLRAMASVVRKETKQ